MELNMGAEPHENEYRGFRLLLTGASGFLGSEILRQAVAQGFVTRAVGRQWTNRRSDRSATFVSADVADPTMWSSLCEGMTTVIHAAGLAHQFGRSGANREDFFRVNAEGTANVLRGAAAAGVRHVVLVSSVSVYGGGCPARDESSPCLARDPYGESKKQAEDIAREIARHSGMHLTILRMATIYGDGDPGNIGRLLRAIDGQRFVWVGTGDNCKSLIHVSDAARACLLTAQSPPVSPCATYNVSASPVKVRQIVEAFADGLQRPLPLWHISADLIKMVTCGLALCSAGFGPPARIHRTIRKWLADDVYLSDRFAKDFSFRPEVSLEKGLARQVQRHIQQKAA